MSGISLWMPLVVFGLALIFFTLGRSRAVTVANGDLSSLHSRPVAHGLLPFIWVLVVGLGVGLIGLIGGQWLINSTLLSDIRTIDPSIDTLVADVVLRDAKSIAAGDAASGDDALRQQIAAKFVTMSRTLNWVLVLLPLAAGGAVGAYFYSKISPEWRARNRSERMIRIFLLICAAIAILTTIGIVLSLIGETLSFFAKIGWRVDKFLFGTDWSPLAGVHAGELNPDRVGAAPVFIGTLLITFIAMCVAVPVGLFAAIYLSDFASPRVRAYAKPMLEILAGIPTVVYGFFAAITVAPIIRGNGNVIVPVLTGIGGIILGLIILLLLARLVKGAREWMTTPTGQMACWGIVGASVAVVMALLYRAVPDGQFSVASESALAAGAVMGIMIIPFISSLSDDVINSVPQALRDGSLGLGATKAETMRLVVLPAAFPGIISAVLLGISRAIGETMIVVMAAGQSARWFADAPLTILNPLEAASTVTVQIVMLITGDTEAETAAGPAFTLGFTLFFVTLILNAIALRIVRKYREAYD